MVYVEIGSSSKWPPGVFRGPAVSALLHKKEKVFPEVSRSSPVARDSVPSWEICGIRTRRDPISMQGL